MASPPPFVLTFAASDPTGGAGLQAGVLRPAELLAGHPQAPVSLAPVLAAGRGDPLASAQIVAALRELIVPQATVVTPNSLEARRLAAMENDDEPDLAECARGPR